MIYGPVSRGGFTVSPWKVSCVKILDDKIRRTEERICMLSARLLKLRVRRGSPDVITAIEEALRELRISKATMSAELKEKERVDAQVADVLLNGKSRPALFPVDEDSTFMPYRKSPKHAANNSSKQRATKGEDRKASKVADLERRAAAAQRDVSYLQTVLQDAQAAVDNDSNSRTKRATKKAACVQDVRERLHVAENLFSHAEKTYNAFITRGGKRGNKGSFRG